MPFLQNEFTSTCLFKVPSPVNDLLNCEQKWDFSPLWIILWILSLLAKGNDLLHCTHLCRNWSSEWVSLWSCISPSRPNVFLHWSHSSGLSALLCFAMRLQVFFFAKLNFQQSLKIMQGVLKCICKGGPYLPTFPFTVEWKTNKWLNEWKYSVEPFCEFVYPW